MIPVVERTRLRPPVQLFQPLSHLNSVRFASIALFTVWALDSQEGQQVASQVHDPPRRIRVFRLTGCCVPRWEPLFGEARRIMPQDEGVVSIKLGHISMHGDRQGPRRKARRSPEDRRRPLRFQAQPEDGVLGRRCRALGRADHEED
jgi:hypothetical protein